MRYTTGIIADVGSIRSPEKFSLRTKLTTGEQGTKSLYNLVCHGWRVPRGEAQCGAKFGQANSLVPWHQFTIGS